MNLSTLLTNEPWAMTEAGYRSALRAVLDHNEIEKFKGAPAQSAAEASGEMLVRSSFMVESVRDLDVDEDGVATIPIAGYLTPQSYWDGDRASYEWIGSALRAALDADEVTRIVFAVDTAGGIVSGVEGLASEIFAARSVKPTVAFVSGQAASAGYWLASSAERMIVTRTSIVGSIGVLWTALDFSKLDAEMGIEEIRIVSSQSPLKDFDPGEDEGEALIKEMIDAIADVFIEDVARNRGVSEGTVMSDFGQGWVKVGAAAVAANMADEVGSLDDALGGGSPSELQPPIAASDQHGSHNQMEFKIEDLSAAFLEKHAPTLLASIRQEAALEATKKVESEAPDVEKVTAEAKTAGADSERERVLGIQEAAKGTGFDELTAEMVADPSVSIEAAKGRLFEADKAAKAGKPLKETLRGS